MKIRVAAVKPRVHIFGHIHGGYGVAQSKNTTFINACTSTEAYQALNRPIVVDLTATGATVHGIEANPRKARLEKVLVMAAVTEAGPMQKAETWFPEAHLAAMKEMADLRGLSMESLIQSYAMRGLHSDLPSICGRKANQPTGPFPTRGSTMKPELLPPAELLAHLLTTDYGGVEHKRARLIRLLRESGED